MKINKPVLTIIIFIITLILIFLFVMPKYKELSGLQNTMAQKQSDYDSQSLYYAKVSEIIKSIDSRQDALEKINSALPSDFYFSSLAYFFQKKGAEAGLVVKSLTLSQVSLASAQDDSIKNIVFTMHLTGTYEGFKHFLSSLDTSARLFEVNSISFSSPESLQVPNQIKKQSTIYDFNVEVKTHTY